MIAFIKKHFLWHIVYTYTPSNSTNCRDDFQNKNSDREENLLIFEATKSQGVNLK